MTDCKNIRTIGRSSKINVAIACVDQDPSGLTLLPLGAVTTKSFNIEGNTLEATDSFASSGFTENQMGTSSFTISVSGNYVRDAGNYPNFMFISQLLKHRFNSVKQDLSQDPVIYVEYVRADVTIKGFMLINSISVEDPDAEFSTFSLELSNATSPTYPIEIVDTPTA